jgi:hypothetical protein
MADLKRGTSEVCGERRKEAKEVGRKRRSEEKRKGGKEEKRKRGRETPRTKIAKVVDGLAGAHDTVPLVPAHRQLEVLMNR